MGLLLSPNLQLFVLYDTAQCGLVRSVMVCHSVYQCNPKHPFRDNLARSTHGKGFVLTQRVHQAVVDRILSSDY